MLSILGFIRGFFGRRPRRRDDLAPACARPQPTCVEPTAAPVDEQLPAGDDQTDGWWVPQEGHARDGAAAALDLRRYRAFRKRVRKVLHDPEIELPTLPQVAQRALLLLQEPNADYRRVADVVAQDPALAAQVLRVASSSAYAALFKITRLEAAFTRIGQRGLQSIILTSAVKKLTISVGNRPLDLGEELWQTAIASAALMADLSARFHVQAEDAFLIGLLHDIGSLALLRAANAGKPHPADADSRALFEQVCRELHEPLGRRIARAWRLQAPLPDLIGNHHAEPAENGDHNVKYRLLIQLVDVACSLLGYRSYVPCDFFALPCVRRLKITNDAETRRWLASFPAIIAERTGLL